MGDLVIAIRARKTLRNNFNDYFLMFFVVDIRKIDIFDDFLIQDMYIARRVYRTRLLDEFVYGRRNVIIGFTKLTCEKKTDWRAPRIGIVLNRSFRVYVCRNTRTRTCGSITY